MKRKWTVLSMSGHNLLPGRDRQPEDDADL